MGKTYRQYCPVAHALDLVGERWELLVVRELMLGPKRYTDLAEALPGCGTNILAARLKGLDEAGIIRKTKLPPPAAVSVYELTDYGRALEDVLQALGRWGAKSMGPPRPGDCWSMYAVQASFRPEAAVDGIYELRFDEDDASVTLRVHDGALETSEGSSEDADLVLGIDPATLMELLEGTLGVREGARAGRFEILRGTEKQVARLVSMFSFATPATAAA
jgi:DNA-binding HxlR family transcriptional regulator